MKEIYFTPPLRQLSHIRICCSVADCDLLLGHAVYQIWILAGKISHAAWVALLHLACACHAEPNALGACLHVLLPLSMDRDEQNSH